MEEPELLETPESASKGSTFRAISGRSEPLHPSSLLEPAVAEILRG